MAESLWPCQFAVPNNSSFIHLASATQASAQSRAAEPTHAQGPPSTSDEDNTILTIAEARFFRFSWPREILFWVLCLATAFLLRLLLRWNEDWHAFLRYAQVEASDPLADYALIKSVDKRHSLVTVLCLDVQQPATARTWEPISKVRSRSLRLEWSNLLQWRMFEWREERFWFHPSTQKWSRIRFNINVPFSTVHSRAAATAWMESKEGPIADDRRCNRSATYGPNLLDIKPKPYLLLLMDEALRPFFLFQMFSMGVWLSQEYFVYAYTILGLSLVAIAQGAFTTWVNMRSLQKLALSDGPIRRLFCSMNMESNDSAGWSPLPSLSPIDVRSSQLLPGDLVYITAGMVLPCDIVLLTGSCVVNEAMLTGESAPVLKSPLPVLDETLFDPLSDRDAKYILFSGTRVIQARTAAQAPVPLPTLDGVEPPISLWQLSKDACVDATKAYYLKSTGSIDQALKAESAYRSAHKGPSMPVIGMVLQTGFSTAKGQLIRAILYPKPTKFDFQRQSYNFILILLLACLAGCLATVAYSVQQQVDPLTVFKSCLNLLTVCIPPALPLALSIGLSAAFLRIEQLGIFCTSPPRITAAGRVNCLCFDKTGTLTEEGLTLEGIQPVEASASGQKLMMSTLQRSLGQFYKATLSEAGLAVYHSDIESLSTEELARSLRTGLVHVLAACHGLSVLDTPTSASTKIVTAIDSAPPQLTTHQPNNYRTISNPDNEQILLNGYSREMPPNREYENMKARFVGDPLEVQMFFNTGWSFLAKPDQSSEEHSNSSLSLPPADDIAMKVWSLPELPLHVDTVLFPPTSPLQSGDCALAVLRRFDFDSSLRRMSVLVQQIPVDNLREEKEISPIYTLLTKGAPESIKEICRPQSIPQDYDETLHRLTIDGFRVLACAVRPWVQSSPDSSAHLMVAPRSQLEDQLLFVGFLVMENKLKAETVGHLETYTRAGLRCVMVTGDNPLTAIAVAKRCGPFFVRPSRKTFLLDLEQHPQTKPRLILKDVLKPDKIIDFDNYLSHRLDGYRINQNAHFATSSDIEAARSISLQELGGEVDLVVTGAAFIVLQAHNDEIILDRQAAKLRQDQSASIFSYFRSIWRSCCSSQRTYANIDIPEKIAGPTVITASGDSVPLTPLQVVLSRANVFARMSPQNKQQLMMSLQELAYVVCMTGDGANDSGALKAADIGISIQASASAPTAQKQEDQGVFNWFRKQIQGNEAEASSISANDADQAQIAAAPSIAAPFSTRIAHIGAVHFVLTEGRCALVSTFAMFKFMFCYGVIQFTSVLVLYKLVLELADYQYLWADLGLVFPLVLTMPLITAQKTLCRGRPESDLLAPSVFRSVLGLCTIIVSFQVVASEMLHWQPFYTPPIYGETDTKLNIDTTASYLFSNFQYIAVGAALSQSFGLFRQPLYYHPLLCAVIVIQLSSISLFLLVASDGMQSAFSIVPLPEDFRWKLWGLAIGNSVAFVLFERFFVPHKSPDEDPIDADAILGEIPQRDSTEQHQQLTCCTSNKDPKPDCQLTLLPKIRWRVPTFVVVEEISSPVWSALSQPV